MRHSNKHVFNAITTGLSLALGLNFLVRVQLLQVAQEE